MVFCINSQEVKMWKITLGIFVIGCAIGVDSQFTTNGDRCAAVYTYKGKQYVGCTTDFIGIPWCGLKDVVPTKFSVGAWGFCNETGPKTTASYQTTFSPRTTADYAQLRLRLRAATMKNIQAGKEDAACQVTTIGGNAPNDTLCSLPFRYEDKVFSTCTGEDAKGAWCSIDPVYNRRWGFCQYSGTLPTVRGNSNGAPCVFPFEYKDEVFDFCSTVDNNYVPWCATTDDYPKDGKWGNCDFPSCI